MPTKLKSTPVTGIVKVPVPSGRMVVADPCYIDGDNGGLGGLSNLGHVLDVRPGEWITHIETGTVVPGFGDDRVTRLIAKHSQIGLACGWISERVGMASVDSGQMYIGDVGNAPLDYETVLRAYGDDFGINCLAVEGGIVSSTGIGDGCYPVTVLRNERDEVVEVTVDFMLEDEEEAE